MKNTVTAIALSKRVLQMNKVNNFIERMWNPVRSKLCSVEGSLFLGIGLSSLLFALFLSLLYLRYLAFNNRVNLKLLFFLLCLVVFLLILSFYYLLSKAIIIYYFLVQLLCNLLSYYVVSEHNIIAHWMQILEFYRRHVLLDLVSCLYKLLTSLP